MNYSKKQLHEAYSIEYHAHKQTQTALNQEIRAHASTRSRLMELSKKMASMELDYIVEGARRFYAAINTDFPQDAHAYYKEVLELPGAFSVVNIGKGFIVGFVTPSFLEPTKLQCQELAWWVEPEYRGTSVAIRLLKEYERIAIEKGANQIGMVCLEQLNMEGLDSIYKRMGYKLYEQHYMKEI